MQADYMILADAAAAENGKLYIHGAGWDRIFGTSFPITHALMAVAVRLRVPWSDTNQKHGIELDILDEDGNSILPTPPGTLRGEINVGRPPNLEPGSDQVIPLAFSLVSVKFEKPGVYAVVLRIDSLDALRSPFTVMAVNGVAA